MSKVLEMSKTSFRLCHWTKSSFFAQGDWFQNNSKLKQWDHWCPRRHEYQPEVWCLTWWNTSVSHNESECLCFNSHCTNLLTKSTEREKRSTSGCYFWHLGHQHSRCLSFLLPVYSTKKLWLSLNRQRVILAVLLNALSFVINNCEIMWVIT